MDIPLAVLQDGSWPARGRSWRLHYWAKLNKRLKNSLNISVRGGDHVFGRVRVHDGNGICYVSA